MNPKRKLLWLLPLSITLFAFANSSLSGEQSTMISSSFLQYVLQLFQSFFSNIPIEHLHLVIRKTAHFAEYTALGFSMFFADYYQEYQFLNKKSILFFLFIIPILDESIQLYTSGRSFQITDMFIDWIGIIFGFILFLLLYKLFLKKRNQTF